MKPQPESSTQEVLAGLVERVTYHNAENSFCVLRAKTRGHRDLVTVVGHAAVIAAEPSTLRSCWTSADTMQTLSPPSQMWIFSLYEFLRTLLERARRLIGYSERRFWRCVTGQPVKGYREETKSSQ
jgi:hypothetical protein